MLRKQNSLVYSDYSIDSSAVLTGTGIIHPMIAAKAVPNDVTITNTSNMILTGANMSGKSTFLKALAINVLLAQTITVVFAKSFTITPFALIASQMYIPDDVATRGESLFEAEMRRTHANLTAITRHNRENAPTIIFMDELFTSTNAVEGISGSYAVLKALGRSDNNLCLCTTHFAYLHNLESTGRYKIYNMRVKYTRKGIHFPYQLKLGMTQQTIALELLKLEGFDEEIITEALSVKQHLLKNAALYTFDHTTKQSP